MVTSVRTQGQARRQPTAVGSPARRRRNLPLAVGGVLVVLACALLFALAWMQAGQRQPVLAVTQDVAAGQVITAGDLQVIRVSASGPVSLLPAAQEPLVVGRPAAAFLPAGTLLTQGEVGTPPPVRGQVRLGASLKPGQYPPDLSPGQEVDVLATPASAAGTAGSQGSAQAAALPVGTAVVLAISPQPSADEIVVELQVSQNAMPQVAAAAASGQMALATVPQGR
jgi:hypothetical protein